MGGGWGCWERQDLLKRQRNLTGASAARVSSRPNQPASLRPRQDRRPRVRQPWWGWGGGPGPERNSHTGLHTPHPPPLFCFFFLNQETTQTQHPIWFITRGKKRLEKNIQLSQRSVKTQVPMPWSERQQQTSTSSKSSANGAFLKQMQYQTGFCHLGWHLHAFGSHPA